MMMKLEAVTPRAARWLPMQETPSANTYVGIIQTHHFFLRKYVILPRVSFPLRFNIKNQMLRLAQSDLLKPAYDFFFPQLSDGISMRCRRNTAQGGSFSRTNARTNLEAYGDKYFSLAWRENRDDTFFLPAEMDGRSKTEMRLAKKGKRA